MWTEPNERELIVPNVSDPLGGCCSISVPGTWGRYELVGLMQQRPAFPAFGGSPINAASIPGNSHIRFR